MSKLKKEIVQKKNKIKNKIPLVNAPSGRPVVAFNDDVSLLFSITADT